MTVPYHSHNFEIPTASRQDVLEGAAADKVVVPACLGNAAAADIKDFATAAQGIKADNAVPAARFIRAGTGLAGGGTLTQDITLALGQEQLQSIAAARQQAEEAIQKANAAGDVHSNELGIMAFQNTVPLRNIGAEGVLDSSTVLHGDGVWRQISAGSGGNTGSAGGDMRQAFYDPRKKQADVFDMDNMTEGHAYKIFSAVDKTKLTALPEDAVSAKIEVQAGEGLAGGGALAGNVQLKLSDAALAALDKSKDAVQKSDLGVLSFRNKVAITDMEAGGQRTGKSFLRGDGIWAEPESALPAGMIAPFACVAPPEGWLACNGQEVSRQDYAALYAAIGTLYGAGNGHDTFTVPDLRGEFIRGSDAGRGIDKDRIFGSAQEDAMQNATGSFGESHSLLTSSYFSEGKGVFSLELKTKYYIRGLRGDNLDEQYELGRGIGFDLSRSVRTAEETRPRNIALLYCIKV